jgi:phage gpG-like protein
VPIKKIGDWGLARAILKGLPKKTDDALHKAAMQEAHYLRGEIIKGITSQAPAGKRFRALNPLAIPFRRDKGFNGKKILIQRGDLRNSINVITKGDLVFVGVSRNAKRKKGIGDVVKLAEIHEYGTKPKVIEVTPRMRAFFFGVLKRQGITPKRQPGSTMHLGFIVMQIPARPFLRPIFAKFAKPRDVKRRFETRMRKLLGLPEGDLGPRRPKLSGGGGGGIGSTLTIKGGGVMRDPKSGRFLPRLTTGGPKRDPRTGRFLKRP